MRLGGRERPPLGKGRRLYEILSEALGEVDNMALQLELGGALIERRSWDDLPPWAREVFEGVAARVEHGR